MQIPLAEYARAHGKDVSSARHMAIRGGFQTAQKVGRNWMIDDAEPYPDARTVDGRKRKAQAANTSAPQTRREEVLNYCALYPDPPLQLDGLAMIPDDMLHRYTPEQLREIAGLLHIALTAR